MGWHAGGYHLGQGGRGDVPSCLPRYRLRPAHGDVVEMFVASGLVMVVLVMLDHGAGRVWIGG